MEWKSSAEYLSWLKAQSRLPYGIKISTTQLRFYPSEKPVVEPLPMKLSAVILDEPTSSFAAVLTQNAFYGAPIKLAREVLQEEQVRGVLVNTKIANVGAPGGYEDAKTLQRVLAQNLGAPENQFFVLSTGIIGWKLPVNDMVQELPKLVGGLGQGELIDLAKAIMTTDSYPKLRCVPLGDGQLCGVIKGAGMIEPNLATMIGLVFTDVSISRDELREALSKAAQESFNLISVDGDQSTSDAVLAFSSNKKPPVSSSEFRERLTQLCQQLAEDVVRNGEGAAHVLEVRVRGAPSEAVARATARQIINSPLVKTAIYGNDPNVGRILAAAGSRLGQILPQIDLSGLQLSIGGHLVYGEGRFQLNTQLEKLLSDYLVGQSMPEVRDFPQHERNVTVELNLNQGQAQARLLGNDLSHEYIKINADYRS
jgi:glutamate N-acetyltransferase/amino-acid N-acetyltransferase